MAIKGKLKDPNTGSVIHPETEIKSVVGLETELAKAIIDILKSGGTATFKKADNTTITLTKADLGLGNVDNTADANKTVNKANQLTIFGAESPGL